MKSKLILSAGIITSIIVIVMVGLVGAHGLAQSFISVDHVNDLNSGDLLIVSGTTGLPIGSDLMVMVIEETGRSDNGSKEFAATGTGTSAKVVGSPDDTNRWSAPVDTSILRPDAYRVDVIQVSWDPDTGNFTPGNTSGTARFTIHGDYLGTEGPVAAAGTGGAYIRLDPVDTKHIGDQFLVTGATGLPVGTGVLWQVLPVSLTTDSEQMGSFSGIMANSIVTKGKEGGNRVTLALDTIPLVPGEYNVTVSIVDGDLREGDLLPGGVSGSTEFMLQ